MKKILFKLSIILGCIILGFVTIAVILAFAPGLDIFGVKYIRSTSGSVYETKTKEVGTLNFKKVYVTADNIPIQVVYHSGSNFSVTLNERYNGYTTSKSTPAVTFVEDGEELHFTSTEYKPFIYHNRLDDFGLIVKVPKKFTGQVIIKSDTSLVDVTGYGGQLNKLIITTNGIINLHDGVCVTNLELNSKNKQIEISKDCTIENLTINSENSTVFVDAVINGSIVYNSQGGLLKFVSTNTLSADCKRSSIYSTTGKDAQVYGDATIKTNGLIKLSVDGQTQITGGKGDIYLGNEDGVYDGDVKITTTSGDVTLKGSFIGSNNCIVTDKGDVTADTLNNVDIATDHGYVLIDNTKNCAINGGSGFINIANCHNKLWVKTRNGDIVIGDKAKDNLVESNITVETIGGDVAVYNAIGDSVNITTKSGNITLLINDNAITKVAAHSKKGNISIVGISSESYIKTNGKIDVVINKLTADVSIEGKNNKVNVTTKQDIYFELSSAGKKVVKAPGLKSKTNYYTNISSDKDILIKLSVTTNRGKISLQKFNS